MRLSLSLAIVLVTTSVARSQDIPLSRIVAEGESWHKVADVSGALSLASNGKGSIYASIPGTDRVVSIGANGEVKPFANVPGVRGLAAGPGDRSYACQPNKQAPDSLPSTLRGRKQL